MAMTSEIVKERIAGIAYGIFLWILRMTLSTQSQINESPLDYNNNGHIGLLCILSSPTKKNASGDWPRILHYSSLISSSRKSSPSPHSFFSNWGYSFSWSSSTTGDLLGTESGVHMSTSYDTVPWEINIVKHSKRVHQLEKRRVIDNLPPSIAILRGDDSQWRLKREYVDGRLIILREETVEEHDDFEYIQSIREKGRLVMKVVNVDNSTNTTANRYDTIDEKNGHEINHKSHGINGIYGIYQNLEKGKGNSLRVCKFAASLPVFCMENYDQARNFGKLRKCASYSEGWWTTMDFSSEELGICDHENLEKGNSVRVFEHMKHNSRAMRYAASLPDFAMENDRIGKLRKCVSYLEELAIASKDFSDSTKSTSPLIDFEFEMDA